MWHGVAPILARSYQIVCPDLRGYGQSDKPASNASHQPYSKRAMANDVVAVMRYLGHERFLVGAHDRGARVAHRMGLDAVAVCVAFSFLMLKGAWDYWANFANLPGTEGRWFPLGFEEKYRDKGWYEVNDIPHPAILGWMETVFNEGEEYEKIPRLLPYLVLPLSMALMLFRFLQAAWALWVGAADRLVASHEVEDEIQDAREQLRKKS